MNIECPKCKEVFIGAFVAEVPKEQVMHMTLNSESELFPAETIGKAIARMDDLLRGVADNLGTKVCIFVRSIDYKPHEIKIGFQIIQVSQSNHPPA